MPNILDEASHAVVIMFVSSSNVDNYNPLCTLLCISQIWHLWVKNINSWTESTDNTFEKSIVQIITEFKKSSFLY